MISMSFIIIMFPISFIILVMPFMRFIILMPSMAAAAEKLFALRNHAKVFSGLEKVAQGAQLFVSAVPVLFLAGPVKNPTTGREHPLQVPTVEDLAPTDQIIIVRIAACGS